jgi:hypothetical protein
MQPRRESQNSPLRRLRLRMGCSPVPSPRWLRRRQVTDPVRGLPELQVEWVGWAEADWVAQRQDGGPDSAPG